MYFKKCVEVEPESGVVHSNCQHSKTVTYYTFFWYTTHIAVQKWDDTCTRLTQRAHYWISLGKGQWTVFRLQKYNHSISEPFQMCKWKVWNTFLTTLSVCATLTSKVTQNKIVLSTCLACSLSVYSIRNLVDLKLGSPASKALQKVGDKNFVPDLLSKLLTGSMKILAGRLFS